MGQACCAFLSCGKVVTRGQGREKDVWEDPTDDSPPGSGARNGVKGVGFVSQVRKPRLYLNLNTEVTYSCKDSQHFKRKLLPLIFLLSLSLCMQCICVCSAYVCAYAHIYIVEVRVQLVEVFLSLLGPGDELRSTVRAVTH